MDYTEVPTVFPTEDFDPSSDASVLRKAMKGMGTNEDEIVQVLSRRTSDERQKIVLKYQQAYGNDLIKDLKSELGGKFEDVIIAMMDPMPLFLAKELHEAISGIGTNERTLVEIICTRNNESLQAIKDAYKKHYDKDLEDELRGETSGKFRKLLISMCACARDEGEFDPEKANSLAMELNEAAEGIGTDEEEFNRILCTYSYPLLRCAFAEYRAMKGKSFEETVDSELSGDLKRGMMAVCKATENTAEFFAEELHDAMSGVGTKDRALIRLVVSRAEIDMGNIKQEYYRLYEKPLEKVIRGDISGDYKNLLVGMIEA